MDGSASRLSRLFRSSLLFGRDTGTSLRLFALAVLLFPLALVAFSPAGTFGVGVSLPSRLDTVSLLVLLAVVPALAAFYNDGLVVGVVLAASPALAYFLSWARGLDDQRVALGSVATMALFVALLAGMFGFAGGYFGRRFFES